MKLPASLLGALALALASVGLSGCTQEKPAPPPSGSLSADPNGDPASPGVAGGGECCPGPLNGREPCPACGRG